MVNGVANKIRKADGTLINNAYSEGMTYDLAGNLLTMQRNAIVNYTTNAVAQIDNLTYIPGTSPSKLLRLLDVAAGSNQTRGYKPAATQFAYDNAGNITADAGKNIGIVYNPIHLPQRFTTTDGNIDIHYTYGGERGRKAIRNGFSTKRNEDSFALHAKAYRSLKSFDDRRKSFSGEKIYTVDKRSQPIPIGGHLPIQRWYIGALELENGFRKVHHHPEGEQRREDGNPSF